ncbi:MAG: ribbon-helix-helix domain-containing protein [Alphaproteobacteria bacterium]
MLINRNVTVGGRRTSLRLEPEFWDALADIATREGLTLDHLCSLIDSQRGGLSRTAAIRIYIVGYFHALSRARRQDNADAAMQPATTNGRTVRDAREGNGLR